MIGNPMTDKTEAQPEALPDLDIDTAGHSGIRIRGYSVERVKSLHAEIQQLKAQITTQTNRAAAAEQQVTAITQRLDMANRLNTDAREQLAQLSARQAAPDGWREPIETVKYWRDAYANPQGDKHFMGHGMVVKIMDDHLAMLSAAPPAPGREPLSDLQKQALAVYLPPFQFSHGYVFDSAGRMVADEGREHELDQLASTVGVRIRGWGHLGKLKNGAEVQDTIGELAAAALNAYWKHHGIGATNDNS